MGFQSRQLIDSQAKVASGKSQPLLSKWISDLHALDTFRMIQIFWKKFFATRDPYIDKAPIRKWAFD